VVWRDRTWDELPADTDIELLVEHAGRLHGRYLIRADPHTNASLDERRVAVTLADQVGATLS
jgi:hypothetical protein